MHLSLLVCLHYLAVLLLYKAQGKNLIILFSGSGFDLTYTDSYSDCESIDFRRITPDYTRVVS